MPENRSDTLYYKSNEAHRKFDYFVTGFTGAILTYLIKDLEPVKFGLNEFTFQAISFCCFGWLWTFSKINEL